MLSIFISIQAHSESKVDSTLNSIRNFKPNEFRKTYYKLINLFTIDDKEVGKKNCEKVLNYLAENNLRKMYIRVYLNKEYFYPLSGKLKIFNEAFKMAEDEGYEELMGITNMMRGFAYKENSQTDSAMIFTLRAKNTFEKIGNKYDLVFTNLVIADLHFWAGQLDKAEKLYNEIIVLKGDPYAYETWMYSVVLNNLGLIRIRQGKYFEAEQFFIKSLNYVLSNPFAIKHSHRLAYIYSKLMEVEIHLKNYNKAEEYYANAITLAKKHNRIAELPMIFIGRAKLHYAHKNYDSTLVYLKLAEKAEANAPDIEAKVDLYREFTNTYTALNKLNYTYKYLNILRAAENKSDSLLYRVQSMTMYAEYNYANYLKEIEDYKHRLNIQITIISLILFSLGIISYYYIRLRKANKKIVQKNLELALSNQELSLATFLKENKSDESEEIEDKETVLDENTINEILEKLEVLISNEQIYLYSDISLDDMADRLNTNRAYLSKTINVKYKMNFNNFINSFRVKEAIKFISMGKHKLYSIEGLAQKVGFNNRVSFNKAFHKYTGVSPSFFIKNAESYN